SPQSTGIPYSTIANAPPCSTGNPVTGAAGPTTFDGGGLNLSVSSVTSGPAGSTLAPCNTISGTGVMSFSNSSSVAVAATSPSSLSPSSSATSTTATANSTADATALGIAGAATNGLGATSLGTSGLGTTGLGTGSE